MSRRLGGRRKKHRMRQRRRWGLFAEGARGLRMLDFHVKRAYRYPFAQLLQLERDMLDHLDRVLHP